MPTNRLRIKFSQIALICIKTCMFLDKTARSQSNNDKFPPQRSFGKTNPVKRSFQDSWFTNRTSLHYDKANDLTFCMVANKDGKLNSYNLDKAFFINGFSNKEHASVAFKKHDSSKCHRQ